MEDNLKYFQPEISDIRVGYECEVESNSKWRHITVTAIDSEENSIGTDNGSYWLTAQNLRVPYLTKEQIEAEGWKSDGIHYFKNESAINTKLYISPIIRSANKKFFINIYRVTNTNQLTNLFSGECKDINTFRYITKLLGI